MASVLPCKRPRDSWDGEALESRELKKYPLPEAAAAAAAAVPLDIAPARPHSAVAAADDEADGLRPSTPSEGETPLASLAGKSGRDYMAWVTDYLDSDEEADVEAVTRAQADLLICLSPDPTADDDALFSGLEASASCGGAVDDEEDGDAATSSLLSWADSIFSSDSRTPADTAEFIDIALSAADNDDDDGLDFLTEGVPFLDVSDIVVDDAVASVTPRAAQVGSTPDFGFLLMASDDELGIPADPVPLHAPSAETTSKHL